MHLRRLIRMKSTHPVRRRRDRMNEQLISSHYLNIHRARRSIEVRPQYIVCNQTEQITRYLIIALATIQQFRIER